MYSNLPQTNDRYILMESALSRISGIDKETLDAIIALHQTVYMPQFESADGVVRGAISTGSNTYFIASSVGGVISAITGAVALSAGATAGGVALVGLGLLFTIGGLGWALYDGYGAATRARDEVKQTKLDEKSIKAVNEEIKANMAKNPYAKYAVNAAKRTSKILSESGGTLLDKVAAVGNSSSHAKDDPHTTMSDEDFEDKYGFTKGLKIVDAQNALAHSLQYFYLMNGLNEFGNKVINKESYAEYMEEFEAYWEEHRDVLPYLNEKAARAKMLPEFSRYYYKEKFLPEFKKRISKYIENTDKGKSVEELADEGRDEFGRVVDKEKYYATMGFRPDGRLTDIKKFSKAFSAKTGLDLSYSPVSPEGDILLEKMLKDPSYEYMKYLPASVFLMTEEDQKPFIEKAKDPKRRGEIQFGRYANAMPSYASASQNAGVEQPTAQEQEVANTATPNVQQGGGNSGTKVTRQAAPKQAAPKQDITDAPDVNKSAGPWRVALGKKKLADMYRQAPDRHRHLMRLGYIMNIKDGKFYRMNDEDLKVMPQVVYDELDEVSRKNAEDRRQVKLRQGRLTNADMTPEEIAASNRRAGLPQGQ